MTTKFDVGDIVELKNQSINVRYEIISIMTITSATEDIRYEIKNTYGQKYIFEEDKLIKAIMTKEEARNKALKYVDSYLMEHDNDDYHISIRRGERFHGPYYYVCVTELNGEIREDRLFYFSKEVK